MNPDPKSQPTPDEGNDLELNKETLTDLDLTPLDPDAVKGGTGSLYVSGGVGGSISGSLSRVSVSGQSVSYNINSNVYYSESRPV